MNERKQGGMEQGETNNEASIQRQQKSDTITTSHPYALLTCLELLLELNTKTGSGACSNKPKY